MPKGNGGYGAGSAVSGDREKAEAGARDYIMSVLADGRPHYAAELHAPRLRSAAVSAALKAMLEKGEITMSAGMYVMHRSKA